MMAPCVIFCGLILMVRARHAMFPVAFRFTLTSHLPEIDGWGYSPRGAGYLFGGDVVESVSGQARDKLI